MMSGCVLGFVLAGSAAGQEWTRFRGPNGSGISEAATVPVRWTEKNYRWKVKLPGAGHSSPVLWGDRIFVTAGEEATGKRLVLCLNASNGQKRWVREFPGDRHGKHVDNSLASATPAVDDGQVYVSWGTPKEYLIVALTHDGREVWRNDLGPYKCGHGFGVSPVVFDDLVIVANDQDGVSALVALERDTGKVRWKVPRRGKASYSTPCIYRPKAGPTALIFTNWDHGVTSLDPKTGRVNWESDVFSKGHMETAIASPIVTGDLVLAPCGWLGVKTEVVAIRPRSSDLEKQTVVYRLTRSAPLVTTPLVKDSLLFMWSDEGIVTCADVASGEVFWRERVPGSYYSSPVCVGNHLYGVSREGQVIVLAAAKQFKLVARNPLGEGSHSTPAVAGGTIYLRTFSHLLAVGMGGDQ
jgi:outer membrane protein assembly factor BamB